MAQLPVSRASALPGRDGAQQRQSARWTRLVSHAQERPEAVARVVVSGDEVSTRTWSDSALLVEQAAAGLVRSGMRADQVVVSLLPSGHAFPELDLALRVIGAVVVHVAPDATAQDLRGALADVDVRLVVVQVPGDLQRLPDLSFPSAELFALDGGRGWDRLLRLGAERLVMDPDVVVRVDRSVDPEATTPRVLGPGRALGRVPQSSLLDEGVLRADDVVLLAHDSADPWTHLAEQAHLVSGAALCRVPVGDDVLATIAAVHPTVLVLADAWVTALVEALDVPPAPRGRRGRRRNAPADPAAVPAVADRVRLVAGSGVAERGRSVLAAAGIEVIELGDAPLAEPDLPVPPPVLVGRTADLPRRSREDPSDDFRLAVDRAPEVTEPDASAFELPSLPLFGGESFLDKLLLARARGEQR